MKYRFTEQQMKELQPFERNLRTAYYADWCRAMLSSDIRKVYDIYVAATDSNIIFNDSCGQCVLSLMKDVGRIYFASKDESAIAEESAKKNKRKSRKSVQIK